MFARASTTLLPEIVGLCAEMTVEILRSERRCTSVPKRSWSTSRSRRRRSALSVESWPLRQRRKARSLSCKPLRAGLRRAPERSSTTSHDDDRRAPWNPGHAPCWNWTVGARESCWLAPGAPGLIRFYRESVDIGLALREPEPEVHPVGGFA